jgi:hypothetical protein
VELRQVFKGLSEADKREALEAPAFRKAILEQPHHASGMRKTDYDLLWQLELEQKFPEELKAAADGEAAIEAVRISARASEILFTNECAELGQLPVEGAPPTFGDTFAA